jgi:hypothetical protein
MFYNGEQTTNVPSLVTMKASSNMATGKVLQFPIRNPALFSPEINFQVLNSSEFTSVLCAAIRALPHVKDSECREELKRTLCELLLRETA